MGLKEEIKQDIRNLKKDIEKEVNKTWEVDYKGHHIQVINKMAEETLLIDGEVVARKVRKSIWSHLIPFSKLSAVITLTDGTKQKITVKLGGFVKLNCVINVNKRIIFSESLKLDFLPWENKERIVPYIEKQVQTENKIVSDALPDDEYVYGDSMLKMSPGLADQFVDEMPTPFYVKSLIKLFQKQIEQPTLKTRKATYEKVIFDHIASYGGQFIEQFKQLDIDESVVQEEALWLLEHAAHREVVKFAITVLGCTNCEKYKQLLLTLGMHEEFTSYVLFALQNGTVGANESIFQLAQSVNGWGKIAAVEHLDALTPEMKQWLLTNGCQNTIMIENLAYTCASKGELDVALEDEVISKEVYDGAGVIIAGLLKKQHYEGIDDYDHANVALARFIHHAQTHCQTVDDLYPVIKIMAFLNEAEEVWEERFLHQWNEHEHTVLLKEIQTIIGKRDWAKLVQEKLSHAFDHKMFYIAEYLYVDVTTELLTLLEKEPTNGEIYLRVMETSNEQYIKELCSFVERHISLSDLSVEEADCVQYIVQDLYDYEGVGLPLIKAALCSDNGSLQYHALLVLQMWDVSIWQSTEMTEAIQVAMNATKDKENRKIAKQLLRII